MVEIVSFFQTKPGCLNVICEAAELRGVAGAYAPPLFMPRPKILRHDTVLQVFFGVKLVLIFHIL